MAEKLSKKEWEAVIDDISVEAGKQWLQDMHDRGWFEANELGQKGNYEQVKAYLMNQYPYESVTNEDIKKLQQIKPLGWATFLNKNAKDPRVLAEEAEMEKYLPLLQGIAKPGEDWYSLGGAELKYKATEEPFKFKYTKEDQKKFLDNLAKYQQIYDRGNLVKEMHGSPEYWVGSLVAPSATAEIDNAVANGVDVDPATVGKLAALDVGANSLMFAAPEFAPMRGQAPLMNVVTRGRNTVTPILDAAFQAGVEAGRQGAVEGLSETGQEANWVAPMVAGGAGATRPAIVQTAQSTAARLPGQWFKDFSRGIGRATRTGDPTAIERDQAERLIRLYNKDLATKKLFAELNERTKKKLGWEVGELMPHSDRVALEAANGDLMNDYLKLFNLSKNADGTIPVDEVLAAYDKPLYDLVGRTYDKAYLMDKGMPRGSKPGAKPITLKNAFINRKKTDELYSKLFPAKYGMEDNAAMRAGLNAGNVIGSLGTRWEPTFKTNPFNTLESAVEFVTGEDKTSDNYKKEEWYKNLSDESKKIIDKAFEKKNKK